MNITSSYNEYFIVFICFCTKTVHLEVVSSYDTESFFAAFKRFLPRRVPVFRCSVTSGRTESFFARTVGSALKKHDTARHFNPQLLRILGTSGSRLKSTNYHLKRVVGDTILTFQEFSILLCQVCLLKLAANHDPHGGYFRFICFDTCSFSYRRIFFSDYRAQDYQGEGHADTNMASHVTAYLTLLGSVVQRLSTAATKTNQIEGRSAVVHKVGDIVLIRHEMTAPSK